MPLAITIGFKPDKTAEVLYIGNDAQKAKELLESPPAGFTLTRYFKNPPHTLRRVHEEPADPFALDLSTAPDEPSGLEIHPADSPAAEAPGDGPTADVVAEPAAESSFAEASEDRGLGAIVKKKK